MDERQKYPSEAAERTQVRLPDGMRDRLKAAAAANNRSMNAEIIARLETSFEDLRELEELAEHFRLKDRVPEVLDGLSNDVAELKAMVLSLGARIQK